MINEIKKLADYITDIRIIGGVVITVIGVVVWVAISWTSLLGRVGAIEQTQEEGEQLTSNILDSLNTLKTEQAVQGEQITAIQFRSNETNNLVKKLLDIFIK